MTKRFSFLICLVLFLMGSLSLAEESAAAPLESLTIDGVTFTIQSAKYDQAEKALVIQVSTEASAPSVALIDNQVEVQPEDTHWQREVQQASQYGKALRGILCDISTITDDIGNDLLKEYRVTPTRSGAALDYTFAIYKLPEGSKVNVTFSFGVNESLDSHFSLFDAMISYPVRGE